ncbi:MAG: hypothetical protein ACTJLM_04120 [Ehrlichia sp.]
MLNYKVNIDTKLLDIPLVKSLTEIDFDGIRNTEHENCSNGEQFWKDIHRSETKVNGHRIDFYKLKTEYTRQHGEQCEGSNYRAASLQVLSKAFAGVSQRKVSRNIVLECINTLHQGGLHGTLYLGIGGSLIPDIQKNMCANPDALIVPINQDSETNVEIVSERAVCITQRQTIDYCTPLEEKKLFTVYCELSFHMSDIGNEKVSYHSLTVSAQMPKAASKLILTEAVTTPRNVITPSAFQRLRLRIAGNAPNEQADTIQVIQHNDTCKLTYNSKNNSEYTVVTTTQPEIEPMNQGEHTTIDNLTVQQRSVTQQSK